MLLLFTFCFWVVGLVYQLSCFIIVIMTTVAIKAGLTNEVIGCIVVKQPRFTVLIGQVVFKMGVTTSLKSLASISAVLIRGGEICEARVDAF